MMAKVKRGELQLHGGHRHRRPRHRHQRPDPRHQLLAARNPAVYLHRVGRTGRIGKTGTAISLVSGAELATLTALEKKFGIVFEKRKLPSRRGRAARLERQAHGGGKYAALGSVYDALVPLARE